MIKPPALSKMLSMGSLNTRSRRRTTRERTITDARNTAITASAFLSFEKIGVNTKITQNAVKTADMAIEALSEKEYFGTDDVEYILKYRNEEGALWGDYFFAELLMKKVYGEKLVDFWI